jgi:hypothetical protein
MLAQSSLGPVFLWLGLLILAVMIGGIGMLAVRARLLAKERQQQGAGGLLDDLRNLVRKGDLSQAEFDAARRSMADRMTSPTHGGPPSATPASPRRPGPQERIAPPGFDLTGAPLPTPVSSPTPAPGDRQQGRAPGPDARN